MSEVQSKTCTKCGADKPLSEFGARMDCKDGYHTRCFKCIAQYKRDHRTRRRTHATQLQESAPADATKVCLKCGSEKPVGDFPVGCGKHGRDSQCRACKVKKQSSTNRRRHTGFSPQDFATAVDKQEHCCAICHVEFSHLSSRDIHADHDHKTGEKRGVLCSHCNRALGLFNDSAKLLRCAAEYLENPPLRGVL